MTAVGHGGVIAPSLFFRNKGHGSIKVSEVMGHVDDGLFNYCLVRTFFRYDKTISFMFLSRSQCRVFARPNTPQCRLGRHRVLHSSLHTAHAAHCIGVTLAHTFAPESMVSALRPNGLSQEAVKGEQSRVPAGGNHAASAASRRFGIRLLRVFGDFGVGVVAVNRVEMTGKGWALLG